MEKQPNEVLCKKSCLRNFAKFTGKHLCQSLFFKKSLFIKKETLAQDLSYEFYEISKNTFSTELLWATASVNVHFTMEMGMVMMMRVIMKILNSISYQSVLPIVATK